MVDCGCHAEARGREAAKVILAKTQNISNDTVELMEAWNEESKLGDQKTESESDPARENLFADRSDDNAMFEKKDDVLQEVDDDTAILASHMVQRQKWPHQDLVQLGTALGSSKDAE